MVNDIAGQSIQLCGLIMDVSTNTAAETRRRGLQVSTLKFPVLVDPGSLSPTAPMAIAAIARNESQTCSTDGRGRQFPTDASG